MDNRIPSSRTLRDVKYEIRGQLANRALELEKRGYEVISLNIGNPGLFGFRAPAPVLTVGVSRLAVRVGDRVELTPADHDAIRVSGIHGDRWFVGGVIENVVPCTIDVDLYAEKRSTHP